jgi:hypothetical protein
VNFRPLACSFPAAGAALVASADGARAGWPDRPPAASGPGPRGAAASRMRWGDNKDGVANRILAGPKPPTRKPTAKTAMTKTPHEKPVAAVAPAACPAKTGHAGRRGAEAVRAGASYSACRPDSAGAEP